jgi:hypothetical protein
LFWRILGLYGSIGKITSFLTAWRLRLAGFHASCQESSEMQRPEFKKNHFCWIGGNTVDLETCKIDEHGMAVHGAAIS